MRGGQPNLTKQRHFNLSIGNFLNKREEEKNYLLIPTVAIFTESAQWADSVIELQCLWPVMYVCVSPPSEIYFQAFLPQFTKVLGFFFVGFLDSLGRNYGKEVAQT